MQSDNGRYRRHAEYFQGYLDRRFDGIVVDGLERVLALPKDAPITYVASHKSHVDWASVGLVLCRNGMNVPRFIATQRLEFIPFFGGYLRDLGAKFIDTNRSDPEYLGPIRRELVDNMLNGDDILFFPEGGRSYTGELRRMNPYFLLVPMQAQRMVNKDIYIVPIAVSYDAVLEDRSLVRLHRSGRKESPFDFLRSMFMNGWFGRKAGTIYIDFGMPLKAEGSTRDIADAAFRQIRRLTRVTPSSLVARSFDEDIKTMPAALLQNLDELRKARANLKSIDDHVIDKGISILESRNVLRRADGRLVLMDKALLDYYGRMLEHLL